MDNTPQTATQEGGERLRALLRECLHTPAAWVYAVIWVAAALTLIAAGQLQVVIYGSAWLAALAIFGSATYLVTANAPAERPDAPPARRLLWLQIAVLLVLILLTGFRGAVFNGLLPASATVPIWSSLVQALERAGDSLFGNSNYVANPVLYFVIPVIVLLILGARFTSLGFGRGHRVVRVALIWCSLPILICLYQIVGGGVVARRRVGTIKRHRLLPGLTALCQAKLGDMLVSQFAGRMTP